MRPHKDSLCTRQANLINLGHNHLCFWGSFVSLLLLKTLIDKFKFVFYLVNRLIFSMANENKACVAM